MPSQEELERIHVELTKAEAEAAKKSLRDSAQEADKLIRSGEFENWPEIKEDLINGVEERLRAFEKIKEALRKA